MKTNDHTLAALKRGETGVIAQVDTVDPQVQRLMTLGLVEGVSVELASVAIGGDPLELRVHGRCISLRREQAERFTVAASD